MAKCKALTGSAVKGLNEPSSLNVAMVTSQTLPLFFVVFSQRMTMLVIVSLRFRLRLVACEP